jgi:hypothetical protein
MSMIVDIDNPPHADSLDRSEWSAAEFRDTPFADDLTLRALVCRLQIGTWQWSVLSLDGDRGELISIGTANSAAAAQRMAMSEVAKCLDTPPE